MRLNGPRGNLRDKLSAFATLYPVDGGCFLNSTGVATISFEDCGDITPVNNATNDYTQEIFKKI